MNIKVEYEKELSLFYIPLAEQYFETLSFLAIVNTKVLRLEARISVLLYFVDSTICCIT